MLSPFPGSPLQCSYHTPPSPCFYEGAPPPIYPLLPHHLSIPLHKGIKSPQGQGPPPPLMTDKAILCYICSWIHEFIYVFLWLVDAVVLLWG